MNDNNFINDSDGYTIQDHIAFASTLLLIISVISTIAIIFISVFSNNIVSEVDIQNIILLTKYIIGLNTIILPFYFGSKSYDGYITKKLDKTVK